MRTQEHISFAQFAELGFAGPVDVLSRNDCRRFLKAAAQAPEPLDWWKGRAVTSRAFYEIGVLPAIVDNVVRILGPNVMLWGADIVTRRRGEAHPWHSDIESAKPANRTVTVWIGLENTTRESSLSLITHSQNFGETIQEVRHRLGRPRDSVTPEEVLDWARERDERARVVQLDMSDGEALFFDGKLWHGSLNLLEATRRALLLQYATVDSEIRIPDPEQLDWPFRDQKEPQPPCLLVKGADESHENRIVPPPAKTGAVLSRLGPRISPLQLPLATDEVGGWKPHPIFEGPTQTLKLMESHASSLTQGSTPHPPHAHHEEELLLLLSGKVDLDLPRAETGVVRRLTPGDFVYYPADFPHTLTTVTAEPANYLMFKWRGHDAFHRERLPFGQYRAFDRTQAVPEGFHPKVLFEGPTAYLQRLHCHASTLTPGAGYEAHADPYDVVIVVLEGEIATLGGRVGPFGVVYCPEGVEHGMSNPGSIPAKYLVFEFEGRGPQSLLTVRAGSLAAKLASAEVWKGKLRYEWTRLRQKLSRSGE